MGCRRCRASTPGKDNRQNQQRCGTPAKGAGRTKRHESRAYAAARTPPVEAFALSCGIGRKKGRLDLSLRVDFAHTVWLTPVKNAGLLAHLQQFAAVQENA
jgi:hypothetical protein